MNTKRTVRIEHANGEQFNFNQTLRRLVKTQDLEAWKDNPEGFQAWLRKAMAEAVSNVDYILDL